MVQVLILVNGTHLFFHLYISESVEALKTMSCGVTPYPDFKMAIPEKTVVSWRSLFMAVLLKPPPPSSTWHVHMLK